MLPLLILLRCRTRRSGWQRDRHGRESNDHKRQCQPAQHHSSGPKRHVVIGRRRMTRAGEEEKNHHQPIRNVATKNHERAGGGQEQQCHPVRSAADERVEDVAAIELPNRHQVERRNEDSHPARKQPRIEYHIVMFGYWPEDQTF
jgi:hypothetical protein